MARPQTKEDLLVAAAAEYDKLMELIGKMSPAEQERNFNFDDTFLEKKKEAHWQRDQNLRDVLIHLYEWHQLTLEWVKHNQSGDPQPFIPEPYNWRTYGQLNVVFWEKHQQTALNEAKKMLASSHSEVLSLIDSFSNDELFAKGVFSWVGNGTLGSYFVSSTSSHYVWALKKERQALKYWQGK